MSIDAGTVYSAVRIRLDSLDNDLKGVYARMDLLEQKLAGSVTKATEGATQGFTKMNVAGIAAFTAIGFALKGMAETYSNFNQSMANVGSVASATADELAMLEEKAIEMGESTRFSASQAADALYYLASAGMDAAQSADALNGVLMLAGSTQSDLAFTSETLASTLSMFSLEAEDAERVANVFAAAIANSQATMDKLAVSMRYVGSVSSAFGRSLEETTGLLEILYNNGFEASQAGTALRSAIGDLANAASPANAKLRELGVTFAETNPQAHTYAEIIEVLGQKVTDSSDLLAIFGDRAGPAMIKLVQAGRAEIEKYTEAITGTTAASKMYSMQNDTLAGSVDEFTSALEGLVIRTGKELEPLLRGIVDAGTKVIEFLNSIPGPVKMAIVLFGTLVAGVVGVTSAFDMLKGAFDVLKITIMGTPLGLLLAGVAGVTAAVVGLTSAWDAQDRARIADDYSRIAESLNITQKELVELVRAAEWLSLTPEVFAEWKKQTGLTTKELKGLVAAARDLGLLDNTVIELNQQFGLTGKEIKGIGEALKAASFGVFGTAAGYVDEMSKSLGISKMAIIGIAENMDGISEEFKRQLEGAKLIAQAEQSAMNGWIIRESYKTNYKKMLDAKAAADAAASAAVKADAELKVAKQIADIEIAHQARLKEIKIIDQKLKEGTLSEIDAQEEKNKAYQKESDTILEINNGIDEGNVYRKEALKYLKEHGAIVDEVAEKEKELNEWAKKYNDALKSEEELAKEALEAERAKAIEGAKGNQELIDSINKYYDLLEDKAKWEEFAKNAQETTDFVKQMYDSLGGALFDILDMINKKQLDDLDKQYQAELEAAGLSEKTALEKAQAQLEAAELAGDAEAVTAAKLAIKKAEIDAKYEKEKAKLIYEGEKAAWTNKWLSSIADGAVAVGKALGTLNPFIIGATTAAAVVQTGIILANPPKVPAYATGGINVASGKNGNLAMLSENGYDELMLNGGPSGQAFMQQFADAVGNVVAQKISGLVGKTGGGEQVMKAILQIGEREIKDAILRFVEAGSDESGFNLNGQVITNGRRIQQ